MKDNVSIEFTQQEINLLSRFIDIACYDEDEFDDYEDFDIFTGAMIKIYEHATPQEPETMLVPECIFPPGFADQLIAMGLARRASPEEVREELDRYEQD